MCVYIYIYICIINSFINVYMCVYIYIYIYICRRSMKIGTVYAEFNYYLVSMYLGRFWRHVLVDVVNVQFVVHSDKFLTRSCINILFAVHFCLHQASNCKK